MDQITTTIAAHHLHSSLDHLQDALDGIQPESSEAKKMELAKLLLEEVQRTLEGTMNDAVRS